MRGITATRGNVAIIPGVQPARIAEIAVGRSRPVRLLTEVMGRARGDLLQELHTFSSVTGMQSLQSALRRGARVQLLANPRYVQLRTLPRAGEQLHLHYFHPPAVSGELAYQHSKLVASTRGRFRRPEAIFTNVSLMRDSADRSDVAIRLVGESAQAVDGYLRASFGDDLGRLTQAAQDARRAGILVNEPRTGTTHLADAMRSLVDTAEHRIHIVSKGLDDADFAARLVQARERGVDVTMVLRDLSRRDARTLHQAGVRVVMQPQSSFASRVNMLVADDLALASTSYQWSPMMLRGSATSRESGVLLGGRDARDAITQLQRLAEGVVALAGTEKLGRVALPAGFSAVEDALASTRLVAALT